MSKPHTIQQNSKRNKKFSTTQKHLDFDCLKETIWKNTIQENIKMLSHQVAAAPEARDGDPRVPGEGFRQWDDRKRWTRGRDAQLHVTLTNSHVT